MDGKRWAVTMADERERASGRRAIDDGTRARVVQLARDGISRNAIVRELGIGRGTVSRICDAEGITFDRAATAAATAAHSVDAKAQRAKIAVDALAEVQHLMAKLRAPHEVLHWDKNGDLHRARIDAPAAADIQRYATAIGILLDKHVALERYDGSDLNLDGVDAWLAHLTGGVLDGSAD